MQADQRNASTSLGRRPLPLGGSDADHDSCDQQSTEPQRQDDEDGINGRFWVSVGDSLRGMTDDQVPRLPRSASRLVRCPIDPRTRPGSQRTARCGDRGENAISRRPIPDLVRRRAPTRRGCRWGRPPFPEQGDGALRPIDELRARIDGALRACPRFFTGDRPARRPRAPADWLTSAWTRTPPPMTSTPLRNSVRGDRHRLAQDLFALPPRGAACHDRRGRWRTTPRSLRAALVGAASRASTSTQGGFAGLPAVPVLSSGYIHRARRRRSRCLGIGRDTVRRFTRDERRAASNLAALEPTAIAEWSAGDHRRQCGR